MSSQPQLDLEVALRVEQGGHQLEVVGAGRRFVVRFPTLLSLLHYVRIVWPSRDLIPRSLSVLVEWRRLRMEVRSPRQEPLRSS